MGAGAGSSGGWGFQGVRGILGSAYRQHGLFLGRLAPPAAPVIALRSELYLKVNGDGGH